MKQFFWLVIITLFFQIPAHAGPFTDEMSKCLVRSTNNADRTLLIKWIFAAISAHPELYTMSTVTATDGVEINKQTADLVEELLTNRCLNETEQALKYEGESAFETSFAVLGEVAMMGIMSNNRVNNYMADLEKYFDMDKFNRAFGK